MAGDAVADPEPGHSGLPIALDLPAATQPLEAMIELRQMMKFEMDGARLAAADSWKFRPGGLVSRYLRTSGPLASEPMRLAAGNPWLVRGSDTCWAGDPAKASSGAPPDAAGLLTHPRYAGLRL